MLKKNHPNYKQIDVEMTNGVKFKIRSSALGKYLKLEVDPIVHPAWTKEINLSNLTANEVLKFNKRFKDLKLTK